MKTFSFRTLSVNLIVVAMCLLFSYAALSKLYNYHEFLIQLSKSPYTHDLAKSLGWIVPATELFIVMLLLRKNTRLQGLYASFALMLLFSTYVYAILHYSYYIPCSCGGILEKMTWEQHLLFNVGFTILPAIAVLLYQQPTIIKDHPKNVTIFRANAGEAENLLIE